jgi:hypothetical protein
MKLREFGVSGNKLKHDVIVGGVMPINNDLYSRLLMQCSIQSLRHCTPHGIMARHY